MENLIHYNYIYLDQRKPGKWEFQGISFDFEPFYIGRGKDNRIKDHLRPGALKKNSHKNNIIKEIIKETGNPPIHYRVFENLTLEESNQNEIKMIAHFGRRDKKLGPLANLKDGGSMTEEECKKIGRAIQGRLKPNSLIPYVGVTKYQGRILCGFKINKKRYYRGFSTIEEAAQAYDKLAFFVYGKNAKLIFQRILKRIRNLIYKNFTKIFRKRKKQVNFTGLLNLKMGIRILGSSLIV